MELGVYQMERNWKLPDIFRTIFNWLNIDFPFGKLRSWKMDCVCKLWYREVGGSGNGLDGRPPALQIGKSWKVFSMLSNFLRQFFSLHLISWNEVRWGVEDLFQSNFFFWFSSTQRTELNQKAESFGDLSPDYSDGELGSDHFWRVCF